MIEELEPEEVEEEYDKGTLMPNIQRYRISLWLARIYTSDGESHPQIEEFQNKLAKRIACYDGPGNRLGAVFSPEHRAKLTRAKLGTKRTKPFTPETIQRMREAKLGVKNGMFGHKASDKTRALLRAASLKRETGKRMDSSNIIPMPEPPSDFTRGQLGKANRALIRLGNSVPTQADKEVVLRYCQSIHFDVMQASSITLAKIYAEQLQQKQPEN